MTIAESQEVLENKLWMLIKLINLSQVFMLTVFYDITLVKAVLIGYLCLGSLFSHKASTL